jgi:hypothetical protein
MAQTSYILYILPGQPGSDQAIEISRLSGNSVHVQDIRLIKRPKWLNGVPILANSKSREIWRGQKALEHLKFMSQTSVIKWPKMQADLSVKPMFTAPVQQTPPQGQKLPPPPQQQPQQPIPSQQVPLVVEQQQVPSVVQQQPLPVPQIQPVVQTPEQPLPIPQIPPVVQAPEQPAYPDIPQKKKGNPNKVQTLPPPNIDEEVKIQLPPHVSGFEASEPVPSTPTAIVSSESTSINEPPVVASEQIATTVIDLPHVETFSQEPLTTPVNAAVVPSVTAVPLRRSRRLKTRNDGGGRNTNVNVETSMDGPSAVVPHVATKKLSRRVSSKKPSRVTTKTAPESINTNANIVVLSQEEKSRFDTLIDHSNTRDVSVSRSSTIHVPDDDGDVSDISQMFSRHNATRNVMLPPSAAKKLKIVKEDVIPVEESSS